MGTKKPPVPSKSTPPPAPDETPVTQETSVAAEVPKPAKPSLRPLFSAYEQYDKALTDAQNEAEIAGHRRSEAVKAIMEAAGHKGPFRFNGNVVTIVSRTTKEGSGPDAGEKTVYFFKGQRQGVIDID